MVYRVLIFLFPLFQPQTPNKLAEDIKEILGVNMSSALPSTSQVRMPKLPNIAA